MTRGARQIVGGLAVLAFLTTYVAVAIIVADLIPDHWAARLIYFVIIGIGWGVPLIPLLSWMENGRFRFVRRLK